MKRFGTCSATLAGISVGGDSSVGPSSSSYFSRLPPALQSLISGDAATPILSWTEGEQSTSSRWESTVPTNSGSLFGGRSQTPSTLPECRNSSHMFMSNIWTPPSVPSRPPLPPDARPIRIIERPSILSKSTAAPPSARSVAVAQALSYDALSRVAAATPLERTNSGRHLVPTNDTYQALRSLATDRALPSPPSRPSLSQEPSPSDTFANQQESLVNSSIEVDVFSPIPHVSSPTSPVDGDCPLEKVAGITIIPSSLPSSPTVESAPEVSTAGCRSVALLEGGSDSILADKTGRESLSERDSANDSNHNVVEPSLSSAALKARVARTMLTTAIFRENRKKERRAERKALKELQKRRDVIVEEAKVVAQPVIVSDRPKGDRSCGRLVAALAVSTLSVLTCFYLQSSLLHTL